MPTYTLTDASNDLWVENFTLRSHDLGVEPPSPWTVTKRTLHGGRREGVDLIEIDNGALRVSIVPTRGMGLWKGSYQGLDLGWNSPVADGPVNPAFVNLMNWGGLGWLEGFDELLARCGLENNGAPYTEGATTYGLHGKIANIPAHFVAVHAGGGPDGAIAVEGRVDESKLFSTQVRMISTVSTTPGARSLTVRDEFVNLGDAPQEIQALYHWNFGPPFLGPGSRFVAPAKTIVPRDVRAVEGLDRFAEYEGPDPAYSEQVYFFELLGSGPEGSTLALLRDPAGEKGVVLRFNLSQVPAFTLWKNTGGLKSGYVTGLEPGTNYPNPKPFEKARGRVVTLPPGGRHVIETTLEALTSRDEVAAAEAECRELQTRAAPVVHKGPVEPFAAT
jgi:hypothetical protein